MQLRDMSKVARSQASNLITQLKLLSLKLLMILITKSNSLFSVPTLLHLSAAFNTVDTHLSGQ